MPYTEQFSKFDIERVNNCDIRNYVPGVIPNGRATLYRECPQCGYNKKGGGLTVTHRGNLNIAKCFHCDFTLNGAISAVKHFQGLGFVEAVKYIANREGIIISSFEEREKAFKSKKAPKEYPFYLKQLHESGLTESDTAITISEGVAISPFSKGTMLPGGGVGKGDDMIITYYDLGGEPVTYNTPKGEERPYIRVRWRNPEDHKNLDGKPFKYMTPKGAPCRLYIPEAARRAYQKGEPLERLLITEGEKKAEKACKHGALCVGIQGIFNIGSESAGPLTELIEIIRHLKVKQVILILDADAFDLSSDLTQGTKIDKRPNQFCKAVIKFKDYLTSIDDIATNSNLYFGYIKPNERGDKGIDDLICGTLKDRERLFKEDIEKTVTTIDGRGLYVNVHKISALSDYAIRDFWKLNKHEDFYKEHIDELKGLESFRIGNVSYTVTDGHIQPRVRCASEGEIWNVTYKTDGTKDITFDYFEAINFISANGFHRFLSEWTNTGEYNFIHIDDGIVRHSYENAIRTFVFNYVQSATKDREIIAKFIQNLGRYLSKDVLERLDVLNCDFDHIEKFKQRFYFKNGQVTVTPTNIEFGSVVDPVWEDRVIARPFYRKKIFNFIERSNDGGFIIQLTKDGEVCEFLKFLINTSSFFKRGEKLTNADKEELCAHLVNKITSIGYLLNDYKFQTELKAIIAVDGKMSDIGTSNGRSGKSLIGMALSKMLSQTYIDGRATSNDDQFLYSNVTPRTRNIFFDDAIKGLNFEKFFGAITGDLAVNPKNKDRFVIPNARSPKFYITTNHAMPTRSQSTADRINFLIFSDWYDINYSPFDDFGHQLFNDWDDEQWNLFDNFMIEANYYYQKSMWNGWTAAGRGCIQPPMKRIMLRNYRQIMGEDFLTWAESYFAEGGGHINAMYARKLMQEEYQKDVPGIFRPHVFKERLIAFCRYKGLHFNPQQKNKDGLGINEFLDTHKDESFIGESFKRGGTEYFYIETDEQERRLQNVK